MAYDPNKGVIKGGKYPADSILDGVIIGTPDGKVKEFIPNPDNWQGDVTDPAINVQYEVMVDGQSIQDSQVFPVSRLKEDGTVEYGAKSNMAKFQKKYEALPQAGMKVKIETNTDGYGKIKLT